jgi:1,4-alpha-glucan branching enzyme
MNKNDTDLSFPIYLFHQGNNAKAYDFMGSHRVGRSKAVSFRVWAPDAKAVSVVGDFNDWDDSRCPMTRITENGLWECTVPSGVLPYSLYKYSITASDGRKLMKSDPYGFHFETRPGTATKFYELGSYKWGDAQWMKARSKQNIYESPVNIYEVHAGSWKRYDDGNNLSYRALADELIPYVLKMGYTHIEFMPLAEYPFDGSWGYQITGYYAATSRYGKPEDLMYLIDKCHQSGIGVILDWVPAHFPKDEAGLYEFDGSPCYEYSDDRKGEHKSWGTKVFDFGRNEVQSFLVSNALFWLSEYHADGLRVDAVASMLYLDYERKAGEWLPNANGGKENLEAVAFLRKLNESVFREFDNVMMIAEESTSWPLVSKPTYLGGLGFNFKWNMGWMNDVLRYFSLDGLSRKYNHDCLTFSFFYAFSENFVLPLSHDEVVHGKCSLISKMPGDPDDPAGYAQKFAGLRSMLAYMYTHPGKKLLFMGQEFGQFKEWDFASQLDWGLLDYDMHAKMQKYTADLNKFYKEHPQLWQIDYSWEGFSWIISDDNTNSVIAFKRIDETGSEIIVVCNFTPVDRTGYLVGADTGRYRVVFSSDDPKYGGTGFSTKGAVKVEKQPMHGMPRSLRLDLAGNSAMLILRTPVSDKSPKSKKELTANGTK